MSNLLDTFLNITVFAFIGLLVWLYFKPVKLDGEGPAKAAETKDRPEG